MLKNFYKGRRSFKSLARWTNEGAKNINKIAKSFNVSVYFKVFKGILTSFDEYKKCGKEIIALHYYKLRFTQMRAKSRSKIPVLYPPGRPCNAV